MLAPRENLERASRLVRADLRECVVLAELPDEIQECLNICMQHANYPNEPLDPMDASLDPREPRDGRRFGADGDSCSRRRALAHDYVATRDASWPARFQAALIENCDPAAVAEAIGVYSNPDAAPSMVTAWVSAASGYYGDYLLPYPAGGRDTGGCAPPTRLATAEVGELGWENFRRLAAMGTPSNLGYYNIPRTVPRPTGACVRRIDPERVPGRRNLGGLGVARRLPTGLLTPVYYTNPVEIARRQAREALLRVIWQMRRGPLTGEARRIFDCWFGATDLTEGDVRSILLDAYTDLGSAPIVELPPDPEAASVWLNDPSDQMLLPWLIENGAPGYTFVRSRPRLIGLLPGWRDRGIQTGVVLHESFHFADDRFYGHEPENAYNAFRFQGFVSELSGLPYDHAVVARAAGNECP